jgi:type II secretory pathway pseudopilin PulG
MLPTAPTRRAKSSEEGFILVAVMFLLALLIISMSVAMPKIIASIQRDREVETYHRGMQYRRAVQLYYRKFNRYPPNVEALVKTNNIRFLRKKYIDPITGKDDWKPVMFGQQKTPLAMGFFGQPLGAAGFN